MTRPKRSSSESTRLDQAVSWHLRLDSGDVDETDWREFTQWLETDAKNRLAFERVEDLSEQLDAAKDDIRTGLQRLDAADNVVFPSVQRWARRALTAPRGRVALALVAASLVIAVGLGHFWLTASTPQVYATAVGQNRLVTLADGSVIHLNTDTRIAVALTKNQRDVTLDYGEALFRVAKDPSRPFIVVAGDRKIRAVGTEFNILRHQGQVAVTVAEGVVAVSPVSDRRDDATQVPTRLTAGRQLIHEEGTSQTQIRDVDPQTILAWQDGKLTYDDAPLSQVVGDLNRYFAVHVQPQNAAVAGLRFSGVLKVDNEGAVLRRLEEFLPVSAERANDKIILRPKAVAR